MKTITVKDKQFTLSITAAQIDEAVNQVAGNVNRDFEGKDPLFLVILNGAFMFAADLFKKLEIACEVSFVKFSSYAGTQSTAKVTRLIGLNEEIKGRNVIIIEDIVDTGITMGYLLDHLKDKEPRSVSIATLLFKPDAFQKGYLIDYIGMEIPNNFIVGYGLDYDGYGRNLGEIYKIV